MIDAEKFLQNWFRQAQTTGMQQFLSPDKGAPVCVLGRNDTARIVIANLNITAVVDDFCKDRRWNTLPVLKSHELPENTTVINCALSIKPQTALNRLRKLQVKAFNFSTLHQAYPDRFPLPKLLQLRTIDIIDNHAQWAAVYRKLVDETSKDTFTDLVKFSLTADIDFLQNHRFAPEKQYLEPFMNYREEVFVDAGGFTGDTTEKFCRKHPDYQQVFFFEPSPTNIHSAKKRLANFARIQFINRGLSDSNRLLVFSDNGDTSSFDSQLVAQNDCAAIRVPVTKLDDSVSEHISFLKMDLEGWETHAIEGAKRLIRKNCPKLAIAVYHKPNDFWSIYRQIIALNSRYNVYLRHYTEGWSETVMYFSPK